MNLTDDFILKCQKGTPILLGDICAIFPLKIGEIVDMGYSVFQKYLGILIADKPSDVKSEDMELNKLMSELSDFQYLLMLAALDKEMNQTLKQAFFTFIKEEINFSLEPPQIIIGPLQEKHIMNEEKFHEFRRILRRMYFIETEGEEIVINPDDDPVTKRIKEQMRRNRERVRKAKAKEAARKGTDLQFSDLIGSFTLNNCGLNIGNVWDITYYAFHDQLKRMGWRDQFNINNQAALAGAKIDKKELKHWMRSLANSE